MKDARFSSKMDYLLSLQDLQATESKLFLKKRYNRTDEIMFDIYYGEEKSGCVSFVYKTNKLKFLGIAEDFNWYIKNGLKERLKQLIAEEALLGE